ncbi:hybrid sensor histidine kinase/response regulator [Desulfobacula toluolica]|uniref:histidine kinase n=1 Tax=Desulfobacula toluolica (strain DSM 7467 / Tol2) TaxID=651182 RepID=K0NKS1_DESTT|nr:ATP-binding protein [Desulfobacula toluolica]CCK82161.1 two component system sensor histidine kinase, hybrid [Desulfobacula toluolica Tol2]
MTNEWYENSLEEFFNMSSEPAKSFDLNESALNVREMTTILESAPAGIGILKNRVLGWANDIFYSMLGYAPNSLKGKNVRILYSDQEEYDRVGLGLYSNLDKHGVSLVETMLLRKDGTLFDCRIRASRLNRENPSTGIIVIITDISELKQLQLQLQQTHKMEAIGLLAGGISHDFNNILMGIQGHLSLMQIDVSDTEKIRAHTKHIGRLVKTAAELTTLLLGFARGGKYQISALNINDLVGMALDIFKPTRKDIIVHETYEKMIHLVDADQSQLKQVFLNLLINASQAMSEQGDIFVKTQNFFIEEDNGYPFEIQPGRYVKVTVKDTGIGMDMETRKKIFDPFFSTKEVGDKKGRGLGLSTAFGVIKNHGGFILVDSEKGKGASFHVCLPASNTVQAKEKDEDRQCFDDIQKGSETVLLVDDEDEVVNAGKKFLEKLGYKPIIAKNGLEAVEIFKLYKDEISLVVLDLIMPKMSGKQAFSEIKSIRKDTKILISTGYSIDDKIKGFLTQGCDGFIQKPFSLNEFARVLRKIIDKTV